MNCSPFERIPLGTKWFSGIPGKARNTSLSHVTSRVLAPGHIGAWRLSTGAKGYSTSSDVPKPPPVSKRLARNIFLDRESSKKPERTTTNDILLAIAKAGTSPRARDELRETTSVAVSGKVVEMELKWLQDPRALSDRVARLLQGNDVVLAVALVRAAQKEGMECTVAWNHLMEYSLSNNSPLAALKFYNEMKKRGRMPNSLTYTIMLDGLAKVTKDVGKDARINPVWAALSIYKSISAPNSIVKLNIIHTNAMLNVCARHLSMLTLWQIAGELPESGEGSPDCTTYSIILRAIADSAQRDVSRLKPSKVEEILARKAKAVKEGKRIWSDVVFRWKKGQLELDNLLVNSMANLLLEGATDRDCYDVFALINQATGIPILAKEPPSNSHGQRPSSKLRKKNQESDIVDDVPFVDDSNMLFRPSEAESEEREEQEGQGVEGGEEEETFETLFDPVIRPGSTPAPTQGRSSSGASTPSYISVGNRELAIILESCLSMTQGVTAGKAYWQHLTQENTHYKLEPDSGTYHQYLRLLRIGHSSRLALELIRDQMVPTQMTEGRSFRIALACCLRDRKNPNVFSNANGLIHLMKTSLVLPHPQALDAYLYLIRILGENPQLLMSLNGIDGNNLRPTGLSTIGQKLRVSLQAAALEVVRPSIVKLAEAMEHGRVSPAPVKRRRNDISTRHTVLGEESLKVLVTVRGLIDEVLKTENSRLLSKLISKETRTQLKKDSQDLRKWSRAEMVDRYDSTLVAPTSQQVLALEDQQVAKDSLDVGRVS